MTTYEMNNKIIEAFKIYTSNEPSIKISDNISKFSDYIRTILSEHYTL